MNQKSLQHTNFLIIFVLFFPSEMINSIYQDYPLANLSTSWINFPSYDSFNISLSRFYTNSIQFSVSPVLYRGSPNGSQFMTGFYCNLNETRTANCFFGILIFQSNYEGDNVVLMNEPQLIWSPNRDHPVHTNATLDLTKSGDMILKDADGKFVWSANTGGKNAVVLNLTEMGNLLLHSRNGTIVWQSFDYPTDILVPNQTLAWKQSLISSSSLNNFSRGLYSLVIQFNNVSTYIQSDSPQNYLSLRSYDLLNDQYISYDGEILIYMKALASTTAEFMRLDPDGHLRIYSWEVFGSTWKVFVDVFAKYIDDCGYPLACGEYGICSSGQCSCPDEANIRGSPFRPINNRQPNFGCTPLTPISCDSQFHSLLELKNTSYLNIKQGYGLNITVEDCKNSCLRNCSCKAAFFVHGMLGDPSRYSTSYNGCLLVNEVFSLKNTDGYSEDLAFLKVEEDSSPSYSRSSISRIGTIIAGSMVAAFLAAISLIAFLIFLLRRKNEIEKHDEISWNHVAWIPTRFSYNDMKSITNNFLLKLGQGGFGSVFEGTLRDGTIVAVKRLDGLGHIKNSFLAEVESIGSIHHVNLVRLIGFCAEKSNLLLVYEYMPKGSLDKWIFQKNKELSLDWEPRKKIILDIAKGLAYLHEDCRCKILHLDIKPQNILLDENLNAKVSDFGLAKLLEKDQSQVMTNLRGTPGYLAPEWLSSIITEKVDVYSFGIVVLEILCGRRNVDRSQPEKDMHLLTLLKRKIEEGTPEDIVDMSNQDMNSHLDEIVRMMKIARWCLQSDYSLRPSMAMVVKTLEDFLNVENNLAYEFTTSTIIAPGADPEVAFDCTTLLPPISLSGPR